MVTKTDIVVKDTPEPEAQSDWAEPTPEEQTALAAFPASSRGFALLAAASLSAAANITPDEVIAIARKFEAYLDDETVEATIDAESEVGE